MVNYKILIYDKLCQILFVMLDFWQSYAGKCVCPIFETQCTNKTTDILLGRLWHVHS